MSDNPYTQTPAVRSIFSGRRGGLLIAGLGLLCVGAVGLASLRHTGSLAFPIDDGYIYSNYVLTASQGHPFTYNIGETSGGITGLGWYLVCLLFYILLAPFHSLFGGLVHSIDPGTSAQAGHLYLSAYMPGALCLIATGLGTRRLAGLILPQIDGRARLHDALCWLLGAVAVADLGLVWGAMSGLEVTFSSALAVWAVSFLISDYREGRLRWSLVLGFFLPWARPDLLVLGVVAIVWLVLRALLDGEGRDRVQRYRMAGMYALACLAGFGAMSLVYFWGWGRPLPSSFYAKVGGVRLGSRFFSATTELLNAGRVLPFVIGTLAVLGGLAGVVLSQPGSGDRSRRDARWSAALVLLVLGGYVAALMLTLPWFGQEDRYLLPVHPFAIVLCGLLLWRVLAVLPVELERILERRYISAVMALLVAAAFAGANYVWATRDYAVQVRNISDGHIKPAEFLASTVARDSIVASEPIGAVKLFSGLHTVDLVGLTTPATLGTYRNWPLAWEALHKANAEYLLFYPNWFDEKRPPPWAIEQARFHIPDNRIAGDSVIAVYRLRWDLYTPLTPSK